MIFDRNGELLAISKIVDSVYGTPDILKKHPESIKALAEVLEIPANKIQTRVTRAHQKGKKFIWIKRRITQTESRTLKKRKLKGIGFREEYKRFYPKGELACHLLGYRGVDEQALAGIELTNDEYLMGESGYAIVPRDARQRKLSSLELLQQPPLSPGHNVYLTIDEVIQHIAEEELDRACLKWWPKSATAIVMDPHTGEILALANRPAFDPNNFNTSPAEIRCNQAIAYAYEPGSTLKPFTAAAALDRKLVTIQDEFFCENGQFKIDNRTIHDHHPYAQLTFTQILSKSSNIGMVKVGLLLGRDAMYAYLREFGFGEKTGLGLAGETAGIITPYYQWTDYTTTSVPMGHEIAVSTLQLTRAYCAFANGGWLIKPGIIAKITDAANRPVKTFKSEAVRRVIRPKTAEQMKSILIDVVNNGTGQAARLPYYQIAGKTGTAQKIKPDGTYSHEKFRGMFAGFAPAKDPKIMVLVILDEPQGAYYGGTVAAPSVARIIQKTLKYLRVPKRFHMATGANHETK
ncbi:putative peptidoglycan D,D-transpeptidase PenA [subsurface metagenome]